MAREIELIIANPAGNTTILVLSPVPTEDYTEVASSLLEVDFGEYCSWADSVKGEQVGFIIDGDKPSMNMSALEFCGNASRSYAYYRVKNHGDGEDSGDGKVRTFINVSGYDHPLEAIVDLNNNFDQIQMPVPIDIKHISVNTSGDSCPLIDFGGISHIVVKGVAPSESSFRIFKDKAYNINPNMDALGVMFLEDDGHPTDKKLTPVVYVPGGDTLYFEGSCASGSSASACALALEEKAVSGEFNYTFRQPAGVLYARVIKENSRITGLYLSGDVEMSEPVKITI